MGCDIHIVVQVGLRDADDRERWSTVLPPAWWPRDEWAAEDIARYIAALPDALAAADLTYELRNWYDGRNYTLFGILANVRVPTDDAIAPDRGLPDGFWVNADNEHPTWPAGTFWMGNHSFTWMTWREVRAYPWDDPRHAEECTYWRTVIMPAFERYLSERRLSPDDLRLVMGFDS